MTDMHNFPRNSIDLAQHESPMPEEQIKTKKSLKTLAVFLVVGALLFLGVMAVAGIAQTYKPGGRTWSKLTHTLRHLW
jgi:hypothetical protein